MRLLATARWRERAGVNTIREEWARAAEDSSIGKMRAYWPAGICGHGHDGSLTHIVRLGCVDFRALKKEGLLGHASLAVYRQLERVGPGGGAPAIVIVDLGLSDMEHGEKPGCVPGQTPALLEFLVDVLGALGQHYPHALQLWVVRAPLTFWLTWQKTCAAVKVPAWLESTMRVFFERQKALGALLRLMPIDSIPSCLGGFSRVWLPAGGRLREPAAQAAGDVAQGSSVSNVSNGSGGSGGSGGSSGVKRGSPLLAGGAPPTPPAKSSRRVRLFRRRHNVKLWEPCDPTGSRAASFNDGLLRDDGSGPLHAGLPPKRGWSFGNIPDEATRRTTGGAGVDGSSSKPPLPAGPPFPPAPECGTCVPVAERSPTWTPSPLLPRQPRCRPTCSSSNSGCPFGNSAFGNSDCSEPPGVARCAPAFGWSPRWRRLNCPDPPTSDGSGGSSPAPAVRNSMDAAVADALGVTVWGWGPGAAVAEGGGDGDSSSGSRSSGGDGSGGSGGEGDGEYSAAESFGARGYHGVHEDQAISRAPPHSLEQHRMPPVPPRRVSSKKDGLGRR